MDRRRHWGRADRHRRLFFCQREAVETIISRYVEEYVGRHIDFRGEKITPDESQGEAPLLPLLNRYERDPEIIGLLKDR